MLEGLENAPFCDTYRYHAERGYGTTYQTQVSRCSRVSTLHSLDVEANDDDADDDDDDVGGSDPHSADSLYCIVWYCIC